MKIVINDKHGGFALSDAVYNALNVDKIDNESFLIYSENSYAYRAYLPLIEAIEKIGVYKSSKRSCELKIVEIPDDVDWYIYDYDGMEQIHENHRIWD